MFEQMAFLTAGTLLALVAGYVQRWWTRSDAVEIELRAEERRRAAEGREETRQIEAEGRADVRHAQEEERAAKRQHRRERIGPILDFLATSTQMAVGHSTRAALDEMYDKNMFGLKSLMTREEYQGRVAPQFLTGTPDPIAMMKVHSMALSRVSTPEIRQGLLEIQGALFRQLSEPSPEREGETLAVIRNVEALVEAYLASS